MIIRNGKTMLSKILNTNKFLLANLLVDSVLALILLITPVNDGYQLIKIVPFSYIFFLVILINNKSFTGIGSVSLIALYSFRMCLVPLLAAYGDFFHGVYPTYYMDYFNLACLLMVLEGLTVLVSLKFFQMKFRRKLSSSHSITQIDTVPVNFRNNPILYFVLIILGSVTILFFLLYPSLRGYFRFFFITGEEVRMILSLFENSIAALGWKYYLAKKIFEFFRPLLFFFIFYKVISSKRIKRKKLYSFIIVGVAFSFVSNEQIHSAFIAIILLYNILLTIHSKGTFIKSILVSGAILFMVYGLYTFSSAGNPEMISRVVQMYFGGPVVMATGLGVEADSPIQYLFNDIYNGSGLFVGLFGSKESSTDLINAYVNPAAMGIFFSFIVQSKFYFGIFAPLTIVFVVWFIAKIDFLAERSKNSYHRMIYQYISFSTATFLIMYTLTMVLNYLIYTVLIYLILIYFDKRVKVG